MIYLTIWPVIATLWNNELQLNLYNTIFSITMIYLTTWHEIVMLWNHDLHILQLSSCQSFMFFAVNLTEGKTVKSLKLNMHIFWFVK